MCKISDTSFFENTFKTSYQRAHYYQYIQDNQSIKDPQVKSNVRPDLYVYDPIINEKSTTYKKHYSEKKSYEKPFEFYGQCYFASQSSYKNIYNEFDSKPVKTLKNDITTSGTHYGDPKENVEAGLLHSFEKSLSNEISSPCNKCYTEFMYPYVSTSKSHFRDWTQSLLNGIAKDDAITYYNGRVKNKIPPIKKVYEAKHKFFFKVPFHGDSSVYRESYKDPAYKDAFLTEVCMHPDYFETVKNEIPTKPQMYSTEQKQIGSGEDGIV